VAGTHVINLENAIINNTGSMYAQDYLVHNNPEDPNLESDKCENLKSYNKDVNA
jgi:hypothetical protein